jgi:biopolymer transport protein ExbB/biopolymer transport protein TolQ
MEAIFVTDCFPSHYDEFSPLATMHYIGFFGVLTCVALSLMCMYSVAVIVERLLTYSASKKESRNAAREINDALWFNSIPQAIAVSERYTKSHTCFIFRAAMIELYTVTDSSAVERARLAIARAIEKQELSLKQGLGGLRAIAYLSPLTALLGAAVGFLDSFAYEMAFYGEQAVWFWLAQSVRGAVWWIMYGLVTSTLSALMWFYFSHRVEKFAAEMSDYQATLTGWMLRQRAQLPPTAQGAVGLAPRQSRITCPII